jgi:hypothetical protein
MIKTKTLLHYYGNRINRIFFKKLFDYFISSIYKTKKHIEFNESSELVILSMVQTKDIAMYLVAIKSLLHFIPSVNKVVVICDENITDADKSILKEHIETIELHNIESFRNNKLPVGGTWERLTALSHFSNDYYVIQMDADTLTLCTPEEVIEAVNGNTPFILGTSTDWNRKISLPEMSDIARNWINEGSNHIQALCESKLMSVFNTTSYEFYIRGCSGFAGFPKNSISTEKLIHISNIFYEKLGERWEEWGTEQFTSNLILSNQKDVLILPFSKYTTPNNYSGKNTFIHFIGYLRFNNFLYQNLSVRFIKSLLEL